MVTSITLGVDDTDWRLISPISSLILVILSCGIARPLSRCQFDQLQYSRAVNLPILFANLFV